MGKTRKNHITTRCQKKKFFLEKNLPFLLT